MQPTFNKPTPTACPAVPEGGAAHTPPRPSLAGTVLIPVGAEHFAIVDIEDEDLVRGYKWILNSQRKSLYARACICKNGEKVTLLMHRLIMGCPPRDGFPIDHINHNGLDNRRTNLRRCTVRQNSQNRLPNAGLSLKGIRFNAPSGKWVARIAIDGQKVYLGTFATPAEAALAYDNAAKKAFGSFALLNSDAESILPERISPKLSKTGFKGVYVMPGGRSWQASIRINNQFVHLGMFRSPEEAARAYDRRAQEARGKNAILNFPNGGE